MALINPPGIDTVDRQDRKGNLVEVNQGWRNFFVALYNICSALTQSGTTAQRPSTLLWAGRMYYDTSLAANGQPIWRNKLNTGWVDATGAPV